MAIENSILATEKINTVILSNVGKESDSVDLYSLSNIDLNISYERKNVNYDIVDLLTSSLELESIPERPINYLRDFYQAEAWERITNIQSRISNVDKTIITCECLIDKENKIFELRQFPRELFNHFEKIIINSPIIISIKCKKGSSRIDIYNGSGQVDTNLFDLNDRWERIDYLDLDNKLMNTIEL